MDNKTYKFWIKTANDSYNILTNKFKYIVQNTKKNLDNKTLKGIYESFYTSYYYLITNKKINTEIMHDLFEKKKEIDKLFKENIIYLNINNANLMTYKGRSNTINLNSKKKLVSNN